VRDRSSRHLRRVILCGRPGGITRIPFFPYPRTHYTSTHARTHDHRGRTRRFGSLLQFSYHLRDCDPPIMHWCSPVHVPSLSHTLAFPLPLSPSPTSPLLPASPPSLSLAFPLAPPAHGPIRRHPRNNGRPRQSGALRRDVRSSLIPSSCHATPPANRTSPDTAPPSQARSLSCVG